MYDDLDKMIVNAIFNSGDPFTYYVVNECRRLAGPGEDELDLLDIRIDALTAAGTIVQKKDKYGWLVVKGSVD